MIKELDVLLIVECHASLLNLVNLADLRSLHSCAPFLEQNAKKHQISRSNGDESQTVKQTILIQMSREFSSSTLLLLWLSASVSFTSPRHSILFDLNLQLQFHHGDRFWQASDTFFLLVRSSSMPRKYAIAREPKGSIPTSGKRHALLILARLNQALSESSTQSNSTSRRHQSSRCWDRSTYNGLQLGYKSAHHRRDHRWRSSTSVIRRRFIFINVELDYSLRLLHHIQQCQGC